MANDSKIVITAGLQIPETVNTIKDDLEKVKKQLDADGALNIACGIDENSIINIQNQLNSLSKNLKLDIGKVDVGTNVTNIVSEIHNALSNTNTNFKIDVNESALDTMKNSLHNIGLELKEDTENAKGIQKIVDYFKELDIQVTKVKPKFEETSDSVKKLVSLTVQGINTKTGAVVNIVDQLDDSDEKVAKTTTTITQNLAKVEQENKKIEDSARAAQLAYNDFLKLKGQADVYSKQYAEEDSLKTQLTDIQKLIGEFDNTQPLEKQREGIINIDNALKLLKVDIDNIKKASTPVVTRSVSDFYPNIPKGTTTQDTISNAKNTLNELFAKTSGMEEDTANRVKRAVEDTTGALKTFYVQVERGDKSIETLTYALNEQSNAYEYLGKTIREADNSTDFRRKDVGTQWQIQSEKLIQFANNADKAGLASTTLKEDIQDLFASLNKANPNFGGDTSTMNAFLDKFDIAKAKMQAFNTEARKENATANLQNRIKRLTADVNAYGEANERATKSMRQMSNGQTFAGEWSRITSEMAKGADLTDRELKDLSADMAVFRKEAQAAGLAGVGAFEKFGNAFKLVSTYISANQVINMVTRNIREAVDELKAVDDRLTEISKTSDRTAESLKNLGMASFDTASKYGRTTSDYLLGVQEMSRAGFGEKASEDMAELSVLAQSAGDMTADLANEYLIATNAAYQYGGSVDKLNDSLDRQNFVTNHYALSMSDLAEATKIAASQTAQSGIGIDEMTAALSTMISTTQQGGEIAARSLRGILMNIQQVKGEVGDGEEDITSVSLSKYEKAAEALGVSLKEVRNGAVALRDPMIVLDELASAFNKEADNSIKKANLISAIGGKYRGNQLSALLTNWDTYKDILDTFNSEQAVGSALNEAEKSANNWAGSLNKVKNSWSELVNQFINSDNAITVIQSVDKVIQNLTDSAATGGLKVLSDTVTTIIKGISDLTDALGSLPVALTGIAAFRGLRGKGKLKPNMPIYAPLQLCA